MRCARWGLIDLTFPREREFDSRRPLPETFFKSNDSERHSPVSIGSANPVALD